MFAGGHATPSELAAQLAADREGVPYMLLRDERGAQQIVRLSERSSLSIGRLPGNDLVVDWDSSISRTHAIFEQVGPQWSVVDDGLSRNGTYVNGARVRGRVRLADRDVVRLGDFALIFRDPGATTTETAPVSGQREVMLTPAQRRVLVALCRPLLVEQRPPVPPSNREIADELRVSTESVRTHMRALFNAFGLADFPQNRKRAELAQVAITAGAVAAHDADR